MKKYLLPFVLGLCACTSEHSDIQIKEADTIEIRIADMNTENVDSRLSVSDRAEFMFQNNDRLGIFPSKMESKNFSQKGSQVEFPITVAEGDATKQVTFDGGGWAFKAGFSYAAYYPYYILNDKGTEIPFSFTEQCQNGNDNRDHLNENVMLVAGPTDVINGSINFLLYNIESIMRVDLYLPGNKTYTSLSLYTRKSVIPQKKSYDILSASVSGEAMSVNENVLEVDNHLKIELQNISTVSDNEKVRVWVTFPSVDLQGDSMVAVVKDSEGHIYTSDVLVNSSSAPLFVSPIKRNAVYLLKSTPVLNDGFNGTLSTYGENGFNWN